MTIYEALTWSERQFGEDTARLDAEVLLSECIGQTRTYLYTWPEKLISPDHEQQWRAWVARRAQGEPVAHILGRKEFWSLELNVNSHTLIPRPETELLVEQVLEQLADPKASQQKILDLGTGTGAVALALAKEMPNAQIVAVDFLPQVVELAEQNCRLNHCDNVRCQVSNWYSKVEGKFDWIVSNPPYIDSIDPHLQQGDVRFEPSSALVAEENGLADLRVIISQAPNYLNVGGRILVEHGWTQAESVTDLLKQAGFTDVFTVKDLAGAPRVSGGRY